MDYEIIDSPQSSTMRLTIVLTRAGERNVTLDTFSIDNVFIEDQHIDYPHQWRATGWVKGELYTIVYE